MIRRTGSLEFDVDTAIGLEVSRVCLDYIRDTILISRGDGDLIDALVFTAALDANMVPVDRARDLSVRYGDAHNSAPDALRRPVSMHAVAQSLGLPVETVRRRFAGLIERGLCLSTPQGVIVPKEVVVSDAYKSIQRARYERARAFHRRLKEMDVLPPPERIEAPDDPLVRAANRALSEYVLRACRNLMALTGDVLTSLVLMQVVLENTCGMDGAALLNWVTAPEQRGRPVRVVALAQSLPFSAETVRRHVNALTEQGFCRRIPGGVVSSPAPRAATEVVALARGNLGHLRRLFARLGGLGVLADWEAEDIS